MLNMKITSSNIKNKNDVPNDLLQKLSSPDARLKQHMNVVTGNNIPTINSPNLPTLVSLQYTASKFNSAFGAFWKI